MDLNINLKFGCMAQYILIVFAMKSIPLVVSKRIALLVGVFTRNCRSCVNELSIPEQILVFSAFLILCFVELLAPVFIVLCRFITNIGMVYVGCHILKKLALKCKSLELEVSAANYSIHSFH
jgi:hypothetical protein